MKVQRYFNERWVDIRLEPNEAREAIEEYLRKRGVTLSAITFTIVVNEEQVMTVMLPSDAVVNES